MQTINIGTSADDGTGDSLRTAGGKINANFSELVGSIAAVLSTAWAGTNTANALALVNAGVGGDGAGLALSRVGDNLPIKRLSVAGNGLNLAENTNSLDLTIDRESTHTFDKASATFPGGTITVDFDSVYPYHTYMLGGDVSMLNAVNIPAGPNDVKVANTVFYSLGTQRSLTFDSRLPFITAKPAALSTGNYGLLSMVASGTSIDDVLCSFFSLENTGASGGITYGSGNPTDPPIANTGFYINTDNNDLWVWNPVDVDWAALIRA